MYSIIDVDISTKVNLLQYLLEKNESFEDACSKVALSIQEAKYYLAQTFQSK